MNPYQIAVEPNYLPDIVHTPVETACYLDGVDIDIEWEASDTSDELVSTCMYYRRYGTLQWVETCITQPIPSPVSMAIPASVMTEDGVDYYIKATDNFGTSAYNGTPDNPNYIANDCPSCPDQPMLTLMGYSTVDYTNPIWEVQVEVMNNGPGVVRDVSVTMNSDVAWLIIPDPNCSYGNITDGASAVGDSDTYTFDLTGHPGGSFNVWFDVVYSDTCGNQYQVRLDPEFDPAEQGEGETPITNYRLAQNYPNPFNPATTISYQIPRAGHVELNIYDVSGRLVRKLVDSQKSEGLHSVEWNGKDNSSRSVSSGIYFYRMKSSDFVETKRMVLLR